MALLQTGRLTCFARPQQVRRALTRAGRHVIPIAPQWKARCAMPSPFPGMDPYLEHPARWPNVHNSLISAMRDALIQVLRPRYWVSLEERTYIAAQAPGAFLGRPDMTITPARLREPAPASGCSCGAMGATAIIAFWQPPRPPPARRPVCVQRARPDSEFSAAVAGAGPRAAARRGRRAARGVRARRR